jgi:outer membrane protein OmpA-like peptidoglycan-associated protein
MHDYYSDDDSSAGRWPKVVMISLVGVLIAGGGFWMATRGGTAEPRLSALEPATTPAGSRGTAEQTATPVAAATTAPAPAATAGSGPSSTAPVSNPPSSTSPAGSTPASSAITAPPVASGASGPGYPTSRDGNPLPLIVTYDTDTITITGFVPSEAAKERIGALAVANSKSPARLENHLVVNPAVPIGVGVRVIELDSARFPEGSAEIRPPHATELERVARVMAALPNVTVMVIGHADQRGDEATNFAVSAERAAAVVEFLTYLGVSPTRLSSRAVGEADLLTLADDETALALNRRTEFVFYGVLVE